MNQKEFPEAIEMEKQLFSAMFMKDGLVVPEVVAIIDADDLYRVEHRLVFQAILRLYTKRLPIDYLAVEEELRKSGDFGKIGHRYLLSLIDATFTTARAEYHANIIKEKANLRKIIELSDVLIDEAELGEKSFTEILAYAESQFSSWNRSVLPSKSSHLADYFANHLKADINALKNYANRLTGFKNIDEQQFFSPGLYVIGATPAAGKTTFCWQLLEQIAERGFSFAISKHLSLPQIFGAALGRLSLTTLLAKSLTPRLICKFCNCRTKPLMNFLFALSLFASIKLRLLSSALIISKSFLPAKNLQNSASTTPFANSKNSNAILTPLSLSSAPSIEQTTLKAFLSRVSRSRATLNIPPMSSGLCN